MSEERDIRNLQVEIIKVKRNVSLTSAKGSEYKVCKVTYEHSGEVESRNIFETSLKNDAAMAKALTEAADAPGPALLTLEKKGAFLNIIGLAMGLDATPSVPNHSPTIVTAERSNVVRTGRGDTFGKTRPLMSEENLRMMAVRQAVAYSGDDTLESVLSIAQAFVDFAQGKVAVAAVVSTATEVLEEETPFD